MFKGLIRREMQHPAAREGINIFRQPEPTCYIVLNDGARAFSGVNC